MKYDNLNKTELEQKLREQQELFEEVTEERAMILGQQNIHLSSKVVTRYQNELDELQENINKIKEALENMK
jgi:ubiquinone biosynthesis protein UbiJ